MPLIILSQSDDSLTTRAEGLVDAARELLCERLLDSPCPERLIWLIEDCARLLERINSLED
jgi:hypothetical protein